MTPNAPVVVHSAAAAVPPLVPRRVVALALIVAIAFGLRTWRADTVFRSQDYADLPYRVTHYWGWAWVLDNPYGPIQPLVTKLWALAAASVGAAMTERMWRMPTALIGGLLPVAVFALMRRLGCRPPAALFAAAYVAIAPFTVSADRYPYSAESYGIALAVLALWLALRHQARPTRGTALALGLAVAAYLLSHLLIHGLPLVLVLLMWMRSSRRAPFRALWLRPAVVLPPVCAVIVMAGSFLRSGQGQWGHLLAKRDAATTTWTGPAQWTDHGARLLQQFGWWGLIVLPAAAAAAIRSLRRQPSAALLLIWAAVFLLPVVLTQQSYGRMYGYYAQGCLALALLAAATVSGLNRRRPRPRARIACAIVLACTFLGTCDTLFGNERLARLTGIRCPIGAATPDPGYKAAGWFVRTALPRDALVFTPHGPAGLEALNAAYYLGRHCLAAENLAAGEAQRLLAAFGDRIDAAVVETEFESWFAAAPDWRLVAVVTDGPAVLLRIYARPRLCSTSAVTLEVAECNRRFDAQFAPRRIGQPLPAPPRLPPPSAILTCSRTPPHLTPAAPISASNRGASNTNASNISASNTNASNTNVSNRSASKKSEPRPI